MIGGATGANESPSEQLGGAARLLRALCMVTAEAGLCTWRRHGVLVRAIMDFTDFTSRICQNCQNVQLGCENIFGTS